MRSTNDGRTWQSVSLLGKADFHALVATDEVLLGAEATTGRLLASTDGGDTWQERSPIDLLTLAAHPEDTDLLIGTTGDGLVRSDDAGRTWTPTASMTGPVAANTDGFVTAGPDGEVATSVDGTDWEPAGQLPSTPQALIALDDRLYAWTAGDGLQHSDDAGQTWQPRPAPNAEGSAVGGPPRTSRSSTSIPRPRSSRKVKRPVTRIR